MFNLSRYFSTVSFLLVVLAAGVLGPLYQWLSMQQMQGLAEDRNVAMAQVFQNSLHDQLELLIGGAVGRDGRGLRPANETQQLRSSVMALMRDTAVVRVKVYNRLGSTIFSTDIGQIGENRLDNAGFRLAMAGVVVSELTHRQHLDTFEGELAEVDLLSSYIPIRGKGGGIDGVFEVFTRDKCNSLWASQDRLQGPPRVALLLKYRGARGFSPCSPPPYELSSVQFSF